MAVLFSKYFNIPKEKLEELGVFDVFLDEDSNFFINIKLLQHCQIPEFSKSYNKINEYFRGIGLLLKKSSPGDRLYNEAIKRFDFSEVNGINLGFAEGKHGAGFGKKLKVKIIKDAYDIIQSGCDQPEIFHLVGLFEENVGPDRLSDMIARIIYPDTISYTKRVLCDLYITPEYYPNQKFKDGLIINPYKKDCLLLLPQSILHELPIARSWDEIKDVCSKNDAIRSEVNQLVCDQWRSMSSSSQKNYLLEQIFKNPKKLARVLEAYKASPTDGYCVFKNTEYLASYLSETYEMKDSKSDDSFDASLEIIDHFKEWVEYHRGHSVINNKSTTLAEKDIQKLIYAVALMFCRLFNWDISPETDSGRGNEDFKISRGIDKTVVEVKLTSNRQCVHGLEVQIEEYAKAENTKNKIFVLVDNGIGSTNIQAVKSKWKEMKKKALSPAKLVVIDARPKMSASKY